MKFLTFALPVLAILTAVSFLLTSAVAPRERPLQPESAGVASEATVPAPERVTTQFLEEAPELPSAAMREINELESPPVNSQANDIAGPAGVAETQVPRVPIQSLTGENPASQPPSTPAPGSGSPPLTISVSSPLAPGSAGLSLATYTEPSVAQSGEYIFYTGNNFDARSTVGGTGSGAWGYINPYSGMSDFCCDQDVIADPSRSMILWYRQGLYQSSTGQGRFILGVSTNNGDSFCNYSYTPKNVNSSFTNSHWDLPQLALSNDYLYISTSILNSSGGFLRKLIMRWPLESLQSCSTFNFQYLNGVTSYWSAPVQGATTTMYIGDHRGTTDSFTLYVWPESSNSYTSSVTNTIPTWTFQNQNSSCETPDKLNPCSRSLSTIQAAWLRQGTDHSIGEIGFMWDAREGGGFPYAYIEAVTFREDTLAITGRPVVWSSSRAYQYPFASPNSRGDLGVTLTMMGGSTYPSTIFLIEDQYTSAAPPWQSWLLRAGNAGAAGWGDFVRNRAFLPSQLGWVSAGHTQQGGSNGAHTQPQYYVVSRSNDVPNVSR